MHQETTRTQTSSLNIRIDTKTPLWTGGIPAGKVDRLHETGILGSLRWWYEAIVRGLGGEACDSTTGKCQFNAENYKKSLAEDERQRLHEAGLCNVCQMFGATGWQRRFRLVVDEVSISDASIQDTVELKRQVYMDYEGKERTPTWYFRDPTRHHPAPNTPKIGSFTLDIQSLEQDFSYIIAGLIQFIADWSALGSRAQMGFGVVEPHGGRINTLAFYNHLISIAGSRTYTEFPSLRNIFFARIQRKNGGKLSAEENFILKYGLRGLFAGRKNSDLRHFIMGTVKGERIAAKVKMSRIYNHNQELRLWGWIPEKTSYYNALWNRDKIVKAIYNYLNRNYSVQVWREMNSPRDTVHLSLNNANVYLRSLL